MGNSLYEVIGDVAASSFLTGITAVWFLFCITGVFLSHSSVSAFRIVVPPLDKVDSLRSLANDPSLVPPYGVQPKVDNGSDKVDENDSRGVGTFLPITEEDMNAFVPEAETTHFCFLLHGFQGLSTDLSYFETIMKQWVGLERKKQDRSNRWRAEGVDEDGFVVVPEAAADKHGGSSDGRLGTGSVDQNDFVMVPEVGSGSGSGSGSDTSDDFERRKLHDMVVHNAICNERKTNDGVINGGDRLVAEMRQVIGIEMRKRHMELEKTTGDQPGVKADEVEEKTTSERPYNITISILGNSMGGLYGRYAIAKLIDRHCVEEISSAATDSDSRDPEPRRVASSRSWILDGTYRLRMNVFCTTASPHLGVSRHTWIRIPRIAELGIALTMGQSGSDLFRCNDLLHTMATDSEFLRPLASFRKRIAYANCYGTDFPVPVETAAFLSEKSTVPHRRSVNSSKIARNTNNNNSGAVVVGALTTSSDTERSETEEFSDELHRMSVSLDNLGWEKVFVDLRQEMVSVEIPRWTWLMRWRLWSSHSRTSQDGSGRGDSYASPFSHRNDWKEETTIASKDIVNAIQLAGENGSRDKNRLLLCLPVGHNMIVAFSRDRISSFFNKGGRPVVDALAKELVHEIFARNEYR